MRVEIKGHEVTSAHYEVKHRAVSYLIINTEDRWVWPQVASYPDRLEFHYSSETTHDTTGVLILHAETFFDRAVIDRIRYVCHNKDQLEVLFFDGDELENDN